MLWRQFCKFNPCLCPCYKSSHTSMEPRGKSVSANLFVFPVVLFEVGMVFFGIPLQELSLLTFCKGDNDFGPRWKLSSCQSSQSRGGPKWNRQNSDRRDEEGKIDRVSICRKFGFFLANADMPILRESFSRVLSIGNSVRRGDSVHGDNSIFKKRIFFEVSLFLWMPFILHQTSIYFLKLENFCSCP